MGAVKKMQKHGFHTIVVATRNSGKLREFRNLLLPLKSKILGLDDLAITDEFEESGNSFAENAREKAIACSHLTQYPVLADDSGLEVEALGGRPGVFSARYAGAGALDSDRVRKILEELENSAGGREARFVCALALAQKDLLLHECDGECRGIIAKEPRGQNGFGYDPIFLFPELGKTFAELSQAEKNRYSHRARAVASLLHQLQHVSSSNRQSSIVNRQL
jgi:XTP/dITP diphosphohydrolase